MIVREPPAPPTPPALAPDDLAALRRIVAALAYVTAHAYDRLDGAEMSTILDARGTADRLIRDLAARTEAQP